MKKAELLATLNQFLIEQYAAGRKVLLIIDEAQNLNLRVLEEIRMLSGVETTKEKVLRIILAGQPELNEKLNAPELVQLVQRVRLRFHLSALTPRDTMSYVLHRLEVAGSQGREIFQPACYPIIDRYTGGVPRLINTLCDTAMLAASNAERDQVLPEDLEAAIAELQWTEFLVRTASGMQAPVIHGRAATHSTPSAADSGPATPLARLLLISEGHTVSDRPLYRGRVIIGRAPDAELRVDSRLISRYHCQVISNDRMSVIEDLNSTNGIYIKDKRLRRHNLNDGDVITLGSHQLMYIDERPGHRPHTADSGAETGEFEVTVVSGEATQG
jgi:hypothetical protein